jgi:hypothetical protein
MQKTTHGGSTAVGTTEDFEIDNISFMTGGATYTIEDTTNSNGSGSWRNNIASYTPMDIGYSMGVYNYSGFNNNDETTESALIVANGTSATSKVSNLVVLDNGGQASSGILVYNPNGTPTQGASTPQQVSAYGYTNGTYSATGNGTPITEVGTPTTGLEGDLENDNSAQDGGPNQNFAGDATGDNIAVGVEGVVTDPDNGKQYAGYELAADPESDVYGSELVAGDDPAQLFIYKNGGSSVYYISPTIIFEAYAVPLPSPFWCGLGLMGILGLVKLRASGRIEA